MFSLNLLLCVFLAVGLLYGAMIFSVIHGYLKPEIAFFIIAVKLFITMSFWFYYRVKDFKEKRNKLKSKAL